MPRADELQPLLRRSFGDVRTPLELASRLPPGPRGLLLARTALAGGDHQAARDHLQSPSLVDLTPRRALTRQILLAAAASGLGDPMTAGIVGGVLQMARRGGLPNTVVTTAPQVTSYLIEEAARRHADACL